MANDHVDRAVDEINQRIQDWLESLPYEERYSLRAEQAAKVRKYVALDGIARASGGKKPYRELAEQAEKELLESLREGHQFARRQRGSR